MQYRQGDLLIEKIDVIPESAKKLDHRILAYGEATGHTHALAEGELFDAEGVLFFSLAVETSLDHQEHDTINIPPGNYQVIRQKEYNPERVRYVSD